jgi:pimeloyl-ACP methyl ester carboxylesterase
MLRVTEALKGTVGRRAEDGASLAATPWPHSCPTAPESNVLFLSGLDVGGPIAEAEAAWFREWLEAVLRLSGEEGRRLNVITVRYGRPCTIASAAESALRGLDPAVPLSIVGYSLGGMVAQEALLLATHRGFALRCAILIATTAPVLPQELSAAEPVGNGLRAEGCGSCRAKPAGRGEGGEEGLQEPGPSPAEGVAEEEEDEEEEEEDEDGDEDEEEVALRDRRLLLRGFRIMASGKRRRANVSTTLLRLLSLLSDEPRSEWVRAKVEESELLDAPSLALLDQLRAATRWILGWDADSRVLPRDEVASFGARSARPWKARERSDSSGGIGPEPLRGQAARQGAAGRVDTERSEGFSGATTASFSTRVVVVAPELDRLFPARIHAERIRRRLSERGFGNIEVLNVGNSGHGKSDIFTPEDAAAYVNGCGRLSLMRTARLVGRAHPSLPIVLAILLALAFAAFVSSLSRRLARGAGASEENVGRRAPKEAGKGAKKAA